jgi:sulfite reductase alpha subunit-like flavoprotein
MPKSVKLALADAIRAELGIEETESQQFIIKLEQQGRLFEECWS